MSLKLCRALLTIGPIVKYEKEQNRAKVRITDRKDNRRNVKGE